MKKRASYKKNGAAKTVTLLIMTVLIMTSLSSIVPTGISQENGDNSTGVELMVHGNIDDTQVICNILEYNIETIIHEGTAYKRYSVLDETHTHDQGFPDIPTVRRSIIIPDDKIMDIEIINIETNEYENVDIIPSKGILPRTVNPSEVPYKFDDIYNEDVWYPESIVELEEPYIIHDFRGQLVHINAIQYNPYQHKIRVINTIELAITENGPGGYNVFHRIKPLERVTTDFDAVYKNHFINYDLITSNMKYTFVPEQGNMLVICYDDFLDEMQPFVDWKNMKGIPTEMVGMSSIGTTALDVDAYIDSYYFSNGLAFVLLVGDISQIPSMDTPNSAHCSDPTYAYIVGDDYYQDIFVGRFSAQNQDQVITQVERSIEYEKYPQAGADWYHKGSGTGSGEGTGDDNEYDWEHMRNLRYLLLDYTYTYVNEFYGGSHGEEDADGEPVVSEIAAAFNEGRTIFNHCGHGAWDGIGWGAMPGWYVFHVDDVNELTNDNKLPFVYLVACDSGNFEGYDNCFGESWLRATNNGEPTGGIGCFASTQSQAWDPPMEAQDEMINLLVNESYNTMGGLCYTSTMSMTDDYSAYDETDTWTLFGDPSLKLFTDTPAAMSVDHDAAIMTGSTEFEVTVTGVEGALCAISYNGELLGFDYTDATGSALITLAEDALEDVDQVDFVITAFNKMTYLTVLDVTPPLRNIAEFDPMQGVLIAYPFGISYDIIAEMSEDVVVTTIVADSGEQSYVASLYAANGVNTANCEYLLAPTDSYWTRDYGPWFRYNASINQIEVIDFEYNRPRPNDDNLPNVFASAYGLSSIYMDIIHTGGNYMTDGHGISISTELVLSENPTMNADQIKTMFSEYLGIQTYHLYPDPLGEYIEHVDCWGKLLSPDTIMIIEVSPSHSNYAEIEAAATYFAGQMSCLRTPYNVVRVYTHLEEPFINSLILNDKVLVPITGSSYDADALQAYEDAMPGYEILGFTGSWQNTDALHCRARGIPDLDMLHIDHDPVMDQMPDDAGFEIDCDILSYSYSKTVVNPQLHWKNHTGVWNAEIMSEDEDTYTAYIPNHPCGETLYYYISAENANNDLFNDPFIGAPDPYLFNVTLVPDIWVEPDNVAIWGNEGQILTDILTIGNDEFAGEDLDFIITCSNTSGLGWLSVDIYNDAIAPATSINITVIADTTGLAIGLYEETLSINSDDPDTPFILIPVELDVVYGDNVGAISVNYPTGSIPAGSYIINATVQNFGSNDQFDVLVNCSIFEGGIGGVILDEDFSSDPTDWTITNIEGTAWTWDSNDERMENSYSGYPSGYLDSPVLDCSGKSGINLSFWHYWKADYSSGNQDGYVRGSIDGGLSFPYLIDEFHHNDPADETAVKTYDISSWANNQPQVMIRFDITNDNDWYWYVDDFNVSAEITGPLVYASESLVDIAAYDTSFVEFTPEWVVSGGGMYGIQITTLLAGDEYPGNDIAADVVSIDGPGLSFDPTSYDAGTIPVNSTDSTIFAIWNGGVGILIYDLSESCDWVEVSPLSGDSTGEHDMITVDIDTTDLPEGPYHCDISISSNAGAGVFSVDMNVISDTTPLEDVNQSAFDRGFPIRHTLDGDWGAAQDFTPTMSYIPQVDIYLRKFGTPEFDLTVQLRENDPEGTLLDSIVFPVGEIESSWMWLTVDFSDTVVTSGTDYFIVLPPAPSGVSTSFGYEWGYAFGNQYDGGSFWFTRDGGGLWRDLPTMYDFTFITYGLD